MQRILKILELWKKVGRKKEKKMFRTKEEVDNIGDGGKQAERRKSYCATELWPHQWLEKKRVKEFARIRRIGPRWNYFLRFTWQNMFAGKWILTEDNRTLKILSFVYRSHITERKISEEKKKLSARMDEWKGWSFKILLVFGYNPSSGRRISLSTEEKLKNRRPFSHLASRFHYTASTRLVAPLFTHFKLRGPTESKSCCQTGDELWGSRRKTFNSYWSCKLLRNLKCGEMQWRKLFVTIVSR